MKFLLAIVLCSIATHAQAQVQYHVAIINAYAMRTNNSPPQDLIEAEAIGIVVPSRDAKVIWRVFVPGQSKSSYVTEELFPAGSEIYSWQTWEAPKKHPTSPDLLLRQQEEQS